MRKLFIVFLVLLLSSCLYVSVSAVDERYDYNGVDLPAWPEYIAVDGVLPNMVIKEGEDGIWLYVSYDPLVGNSTSIWLSAGGDYDLWCLSEDGTYWDFLRHKSGMPGTTFYTTKLGDVFIWNNFDIFDSSDGDKLYYKGDPNFYQAPPPTVQEVVEGRLVEVLPTIVNTMKILAVCGVGLLSCFVGLRIFGTRYVPFRKQ